MSQGPRITSYNVCYTKLLRLNVDLPICAEVYYVLFENSPVERTVERLMGRSLKHELTGVI